ncbi:hypothetical protein EQH57_0221 [Dictyocoela roeselum]|nr:hypothetical protein EQH57_0221 [Dictyocoela roeselum]
MHSLKNQSIKNYPKSLLINNLKFKHPLGCHLNLSSKRYHECLEEIRQEKLSLQQSDKKDENSEYAYFEYRNESTGLKITHRITLLTSLEKQDLIKWQLTFKELARICGWSEEQKKEILTQIIDLNIQNQMGISTTSEEVMLKLLRLKYSQLTAYKYQNKLRFIEQGNFYTIGAYMNQIEQNVTKLALCLGWSEEMRREKIREAFYCGLDENIKFELTKLPNKDHETIMKTILYMEHFFN